MERFLLWFHTRFYQNYYGLCGINQLDQSARDANKKENASLSSEVALLIKVQSHSQKLQLSHSIQTCQVELSQWVVLPLLDVETELAQSQLRPRSGNIFYLPERA